MAQTFARRPEHSVHPGVQKLLVFGGPGNQTATSAWLFDGPDRLLISGNTEPGGTYCGDGGYTGFVVGLPL